MKTFDLGYASASNHWSYPESTSNGWNNEINVEYVTTQLNIQETCPFEIIEKTCSITFIISWLMHRMLHNRWLVLI